MRARTLVTCLCLIGIAALGLWAILNWGPGALDRHLAAAERALSSGRYERAVQEFTAALALEPDQKETLARLELAEALVESDLTLARGREALEAGDYTTAEELLAAVNPEHPSYAEAQRLAVQCRLADFCASLSRDWEVPSNLLDGEFTLASPGGGTVKLAVASIDHVTGAANCSLAFTPPTGGDHVLPESLPVWPAEPFPVAFAGEGRLVVDGGVLWVPPGEPVRIFAAGGHPSDGPLAPTATCSREHTFSAGAPRSQLRQWSRILPPWRLSLSTAPTTPAHACRRTGTGPLPN